MTILKLIALDLSEIPTSYYELLACCYFMN